jgi:hypothetical protein
VMRYLISTVDLFAGVLEHPARCDPAIRER